MNTVGLTKGEDKTISKPIPSEEVPKGTAGIAFVGFLRNVTGILADITVASTTFFFPLSSKCLEADGSEVSA